MSKISDNMIQDMLFLITNLIFRKFFLNINEFILHYLNHLELHFQLVCYIYELLFHQC
jgi:hypothetical protein